MVLTAARGALGFLTRLPVGRSGRAFRALGAWPALMVPVGYLVGLLAAVPVVVLPPAAAAAAYPTALVALTGIAHADGLADLGDAAVVHGDAADRRAVMRDTTTGVGGTLALALAVIAFATAAFALAGQPIAAAVGIFVAAEVGAKAAMVGVAVLGSPSHEGMGETLLGASSSQLVLAVAFAAPAVVWPWPEKFALAAVFAAALGGGVVAGWATRSLSGVSGDVFGATNEVARVVALHAGVIAWMRL